MVESGKTSCRLTAFHKKTGRLPWEISGNIDRKLVSCSGLEVWFLCWPGGAGEEGEAADPEIAIQTIIAGPVTPARGGRESKTATRVEVLSFSLSLSLSLSLALKCSEVELLQSRGVAVPATRLRL